MLSRKCRSRTTIIIFIVLALSTSFVFSPYEVKAETPPIISDGFEGGSRESYSTWGETVVISPDMPHHGEYCGKFTTDGGGGTERAYYYYSLGEDVESLYVRAYFYISSGLPLSDNNDRFMLIGFFNDGSAKASTGIRRVSGQDQFHQICLDGSDSSTSIYPGEGEYYCVESYWKRGYSGEMKTWVNGELLLSNSPANTGSVGINQVRIGLSFATGINHRITIYADCAVIDDNYIGIEAPPAILDDGFEGGSRESYSTWGETVVISPDMPHHGEYCGKFTTDGGGGTERAYYYYSLGEDVESLYVRAYFYISSGLPLSDNNDRFMLIGLFNDGGAIASTGIRRVSGQDQFHQICLDGSDSSTSIYPGEGEYYCVESYWKRGYSGEMKTWVNGELLLSNSPANTGSVGINQVRIGLSFATGINHRITIYADCAVIDDNYIGTEGSAPSPPPPAPPPAGDILVSVYRSQVVGTNKLSLGFLMNNEWNEWRDRTSLRTLAKDADFKLIRVWSDRMEPCSWWYESTKTGTFNWAGVDLLVQRIFDVGAEPLICLGFYDWVRNRLRMPRGMATNPKTGLPYTSSYAAYTEDWVQHFKAVGLPVRYYHIINEPHQYFGWNGEDSVKLQNYIDLFRACANRMRAVNPNVKLSNDCTLQKRVLDGFIRNGIDIDFLSFNKYDAGELSMSDEQILNRAETRLIEESSSIYGVDRAREVYFSARGVTLPVFITEYNFNHAYEYGSDPRIQKVVAVVWTSLMLRTCILKEINYALYSTFATSKSDETRKPTGGFGFGMVNLDDSKPWYPYYLQKMIGNNLDIGDQLIQIDSSSADVRPLAWIHNGKLTVLLIYKTDIQKTVSLSGLQGQLSLQKIDSSISYLNPSVQTDLISSGDVLPMNGYTVVLLQEL